MKTSKALLFSASAMVLFFLVQGIAELSFQIATAADGRPKGRGSGFVGLSLSSSLHTDLAFAWLDAGMADGGGEEAIERSIGLLRRSLRQNPLDYKARYYLAKAHLRLSAVGNDHFQAGVRELKRAAGMRRANKQIALECGQVFFSLWPLLEKGDQEFAADLLSGVMPAVSWNEFGPVVELWSLYVQDVPLLMNLLRLKPDFFASAAEQLVAAGIPMEKRWEMLALHEANTLDVLERSYNEFSLRGGIGVQETRSLLNHLRAIKGYHRLHPASGFDSGKLAKLQRALLLDAIGGLIDGAGSEANAGAQLRELIEYFIARHSGLNELDELQKLLQERGFFKENDFPSLRLKMMVAYRKGDYNGVIAEVEALRRGISFVKKEQAADYTDILLLLVDSYYSSKLMTAAEAVLGELIRNQPGNPDILWRMLRVQGILGSEQAPDEDMRRQLQAVQASRFVNVDRAGRSWIVYLFNEPEIEVVFAPEFRGGLASSQLVQVYVGEAIAYEGYARDVPEKVVVGRPYCDVESRVPVKVIVR